MTTKVLVLASGQASRVQVTTRGADGVPVVGPEVSVAADAWAEIYVPDGGYIVVDEPAPVPAEPAADTAA